MSESMGKLSGLGGGIKFGRGGGSAFRSGRGLEKEKKPNGDEAGGQRVQGGRGGRGGGWGRGRGRGRCFSDVPESASMESE